VEPKRFHLPIMGEKPTPADPVVPDLPEGASLYDRVVATLKTIFDPELPVNIYDLGLIYRLQVDPTGEVAIDMTLTSPNCPVAGSLPGEVQRKVAALPGVRSARVELVWQPPWDKSRLSEAAAVELGLF
jgi:FeS assembly SUF system protein